MNEILGWVLAALIFFTAITINSYTESVENKEAIKAGLEECRIDNRTIWVKDCKETLKAYRKNNE